MQVVSQARMLRYLFIINTGVNYIETVAVETRSRLAPRPSAALA